MGLGMFFGFFAYHRGGEAWADNHIFDLMVQRTYGAMTNDVLISIPLFVLMGYVMERGALVDKMFYSIQLAFRRVPASLAVATLIVCTFWGIASGLVGAVVVLMGVIAFNPMLKAGYDVKLASGVDHRRRHARHPDPALGDDHRLCGGRRAVRGEALRGRDVPGFFLAFLYLVYIIGWALLNPKIAPKLSESEIPRSGPAVDCRAAAGLFAQDAAGAVGRRRLRRPGPRSISVPTARASVTRRCCRSLGYALVPLVLTLATLWATWWYVVIHQQPDIPAPVATVSQQQSKPATRRRSRSVPARNRRASEEKLEELGGAASQVGQPAKSEPEAPAADGQRRAARARSRPRSVDAGPPPEFYTYFAFIAGIFASCCCSIAYWTMEAEQFEVLAAARRSR